MLQSSNKHRMAWLRHNKSRLEFGPDFRFNQIMSIHKVLFCFFVLMFCTPLAESGWALPFEIVEDVLPFEDEYPPFNQVEVSEDFVVTVQGQKVQVWDRASKRLRLVLNLSPDKLESQTCKVVLFGNSLISTCEKDLTLKKWEIPSGIQKQLYRSDVQYLFDDGFLSPKIPWRHAGTRLAFERRYPTRQGKAFLDLMDLESMTLIKQIQVTGDLQSYILNQNDLVLGVEDESGLRLKFFDARDGNYRFEIAIEGEYVCSLAVQADQVWAVISEQDRGPHLHHWRLSDRVYLGRLSQETGFADEIYPEALAFKLSPINPPYLNTDMQRWNAQTQSFEAWIPTGPERARFLGQPWLVNSSALTLELFDSKGKTGEIPLRYDYQYSRNQHWWLNAGSLFLHQWAALGQVDRFRPDQQNLHTIYQPGESEWLHDYQDGYAYFRDQEAISRVNLRTGERDPWLVDSVPCRPLLHDYAAESFRNANLYFQFCQAEPGKLGDVLLRIWDMTLGIKLAEFASKAPAKLTGSLSLGPYGENIGIVYYDEVGAGHLHLWNFRTGKKLLEHSMEYGRAYGCENAWPENQNLESTSWRRRQDGQYEILLCDAILRKAKDKYLIPANFDLQQVLLDDRHLYLIDKMGFIQVRDRDNGKLLGRQDKYAHSIGEQGLQPGWAWIDEKGMHLGPDYGNKHVPLMTPWVGLLDLKTGQMAQLFWSDTVWHQASDRTYFKNRTSLFRLDESASAKSQKKIELYVYSYPDALLVISPEGYFAAFGKYREYFHLARDGYIIPWEEAEAQWLNPAEVQKVVDRLSTLKMN